MVLTMLKATVLTAPDTSTSDVQQSARDQQSAKDAPAAAGKKSAQDYNPLKLDTLECDNEALQRACDHIAAFSGADDLQGGLGFALTCALWIGSFIFGRWLLPQVSYSNVWAWPLAALWLLFRVGSSVRVYVQMHDLTHSSTFKKRWMNEWAAALTALMNPVDPADYKRVHSQHHAHTGMEDEHDPMHTILWTTTEWDAWPAGLSKAAARVLFDPLFFFTLFAPIYEICLNQAWPHLIRKTAVRDRCWYALRRTVIAVGYLAAFYYLTGTPLAIVMIDMQANQLALSFGMFMVHIQHVRPYKGVYRAPKSEHNRLAAELMGSSYLGVPWWFSWATYGIEYHHIHHCNARVPCYRLKACHDSAPAGTWEALGVWELKALDGFHTLFLSLWDPAERRYVPFPAWRWATDLLTRSTKQSSSRWFC